MQLDPYELQLVAELTGNRGFQLLLDAIRARIDDVADELHAARTLDQDYRTLALWRALREVYSQLKTTPETLAANMKLEKPIDPDTQELRAAFQEGKTGGNEVFSKIKAWYGQTGAPKGWVESLEPLKLSNLPVPDGRESRNLL